MEKNRKKYVTELLCYKSEITQYCESVILQLKNNATYPDSSVNPFLLPFT